MTIREKMIRAGIWDAKDTRDPTKNLSAAWCVVERLNEYHGDGRWGEGYQVWARFHVAGLAAGAVACYRHDRAYIGFEQNAEYIDAAQARLRKERLQMKMPMGFGEMITA